MIRLTLLVVVFLATSFWGHGQGLTNPADLPDAFLASPRLGAGFDSKRSFIANRDVSIFGVRVGLEFDRKAATGFGFYFLSSPFYRNFIHPGDSGGVDTTRARLRFSYVSLWFEYMMLATKRWELSVPFSIGFGEAEFDGFEQSSTV